MNQNPEKAIALVLNPLIALEIGSGLNSSILYSEDLNYRGLAFIQQTYPENIDTEIESIIENFEISEELAYELGSRLGIIGKCAIADCITYTSSEQWELGKEHFGFNGNFREICEVFEQESFAIWIIEEPLLFTKPIESVEVSAGVVLLAEGDEEVVSTFQAAYKQMQLMSLNRAHPIHEVIFEERDNQIFNIPDTKTKLSTLQNYFFPRLQKIADYALDLVGLVYELNPFDRMTFVYCPSHRKDAKQNKDYDTVHIGITAKKAGKPLKIIKRNGTPFEHHPTYLTFKVLPNSTIHVELLPFRQGVDDAYISEIAKLLEIHSNILTPLLSFLHISHRSDVSYCGFLPLHEVVVPEEIGMLGIKLISPKYYFPVGYGRGFYELIAAFVLLYALTESFICIGEGEEPKLEKMLEQFKSWYFLLDLVGDSGQEEKNLDIDELPELDSYSFVRAGKWWSILARDKWRCLSCGRSAKEHGVLLEVDHIIPRSKGGSDDLTNLQTLCKKCNIGKSNKDSTRL